MLTMGVTKNSAELQAKGIHVDTANIEAACKALEDAANKQDLAKETLNECRNKAHEKLAELKDLCTEAKQPIKQSYLPEQWSRFGLPDKR